MKERLQKKLATLGLGSRREIERWIVEGRVHVNGQPAELGMQVDNKARIAVDGKPIMINATQSEPQVLMYHKPEGELVSRQDPEGRKTVFENLPPIKEGRWINIGRLDFNTSGLLLFTNHGELANRLMHPRYAVPRHYAVRVLGDVTDDMLKRLRKGVMLDDGRAAFDDVRFEGGSGANSWYQVMLREGRNREVRRLWESQGVKVSRLMRVKYGEISLPRSVRSGDSVLLKPKEIALLYKTVELTLPTESATNTPPATTLKKNTKAAVKPSTKKTPPRRPTTKPKSPNKSR